MTRLRIVDSDGHGWPDTGHRCVACGWPIDRVLAGIGVHPGCDPLSGGDPGGDPGRDPGGDPVGDALRLVQTVLGAETIPDGAS